MNVGTNNFDRVRWEYFRDRQVAFEAFKSGVITFQEEFTSRIWATGYDFPALHEGKVKKESLPETDADAARRAGIFNLRRDAFRRSAHPRGARALPSTSSGPTRTSCSAPIARMTSFFENSDSKAVGKPSPEELALLEPFRGKVSGRGLRRALAAAGQRRLRQRPRPAAQGRRDAARSRLQARRQCAEAAGRQALRDRVPRLRRPRCSRIPSPSRPISSGSASTPPRASSTPRNISAGSTSSISTSSARRSAAARSPSDSLRDRLRLARPPRRAARAMSPASPTRRSTR